MGFHGTSHFYVSPPGCGNAGQAPMNNAKIITPPSGQRCQSMAAIKDGKVVDTSMGFTPLEGLVMGTRSGDIDPAIVFFLMEKLNMNAQEANNYFNKKSGMLGLSGVSNDLRDILEAASSGNERAQVALEVYYNRVKGYIGNYIAGLNGCDCLVFTAGVGENGYDVREKICENLDYLGIKLDPEKTKSAAKK